MPNKKMSKADFIRSHPSLSTEELIAAGKKQGFSIEPGRISNVRYYERQKKKKRAVPAQRAKIVRKASGQLNAIADSAGSAHALGHGLEELIRETVQKELRAALAKLGGP